MGRTASPAPRWCAWLVLGLLASVPGGGQTTVELGFVHFNGMAGELYFPEMTGQGGALVDYDGDGDLDLYLVQGAWLGPEGVGGIRRAGEDPPRDALLRNDLAAGAPVWTDVTDASGVIDEEYGMAVATGDLDGDGWVDLFTGNYGPNRLWRNRGDGTFEDVSAGLGEREPEWTTAAVFFDEDGDGLEDLYLVNYVEYDLASAPTCYSPSSMRDYCGPSGFVGQPDRLLRNLGGGAFEDVSAASGVAAVAGSGLGAALLDVDGDGALEVYVANDGQPNFLWRRLDGRWVDEALFAGVAVNRRGQPEASMGVAVGDFDRDGDEDLFLTHLAGESNTLYVNDGGGLFDERTIEHGLAAPSLARTGFGVAWVDLDHDGWPDLAVANGAVRIQEDQAAAGDPYPLSQANQVFANHQGTFVELDGHPFSAEVEVSRGLMAGDVDNDGDRDLVVTNSAGPARLFFNGGAVGANWLGLVPSRTAQQRVSARYAEATVVARATSAGSYASASDPRVVFGGVRRALSVSVDTARGGVRFMHPPLGRYLRFEDHP